MRVCVYTVVKGGKNIIFRVNHNFYFLDMYIYLQNFIHTLVVVFIFASIKIFGFALLCKISVSIFEILIFTQVGIKR